MTEKIYVKNEQGENLFGELSRGGMFDRNIALIVQDKNNKKDEQFFEELISNLVHNHIPYFRLYNFNDKEYDVNQGSKNIIRVINHLSNLEFDSFVLFGKNNGAIQTLQAAKDSSKIKGMILINPTSNELIDYDFSSVKGIVEVVQSGGVPQNQIDYTNKIVAQIPNSKIEIFEGADMNFSFIRDYRRMYRSVIEFIIENM
ncbi:MAG: hypothetical protein V3575_00025 [Candidatus Absconditabacteria bacterium]